MRIPLAGDLESRAGLATKDAKVLNGIVEVSGQGDGAKLKLRNRPGCSDLGLVKAGVAQWIGYWNGAITTIQADYINTGAPATYAVWNPNDKGAGVTLSGSNLTAAFRSEERRVGKECRL